MDVLCDSSISILLLIDSFYYVYIIAQNALAFQRRSDLLSSENTYNNPEIYEINFVVIFFCADTHNPALSSR